MTARFCEFCGDGPTCSICGRNDLAEVPDWECPECLALYCDSHAYAPGSTAPPRCPQCAEHGAEIRLTEFPHAAEVG